MIFSAQQIFSDDQAITGDAISTNVIDTGVRGTPYDAAAALNGVDATRIDVTVTDPQGQTLELSGWRTCYGEPGC